MAHRASAFGVHAARAALSVVLAAGAFGCAKGADDVPVSATDAGTADSAVSADTGAAMTMTTMDAAADSGAGMQTDGTAPANGVKCGDTTCTGGNVCCVDDSNGLDFICQPRCAAGKTFECDSPSACPQLNPVCCATVMGGPQAADKCAYASVTTTCTGQCTSIVGDCDMTASQLRMCKSTDDCTDAPNGFNNCCEFRANAQSLFFCVDDAHKSTSRSCL